MVAAGRRVIDQKPSGRFREYLFEDPSPSRANLAANSIGARRVLKGNIVALDVETDGLDPYHGARIFCWGYFTEKGEYGFMLKTPETLRWIARLFADPTKKIVFHNAKFDLKMFSFEGIDIYGMKAEAHCTLILSKLLNLNGQHDLRYLGIRYLNRDTSDKDEIKEWLKSNRRTFEKEHDRKPGFKDAPIKIVRRRCLWDVETTLLLFYKIHPQVMQASPHLYETERQLQFVCIDMENAGVQVDITRAKELKAQAEEDLRRMKHDLNEMLCPLVIRRPRCTTKGCRKKLKVMVLRDDVAPTKCPKCGGTAIEVLSEVINSFNANSPSIHLPAAWEKAGIPLKYRTKPKRKKKGKNAGQMSGGGNWSFDEYSMIRYVSKPLALILRTSSEEGWRTDRFYHEITKAIRKHKLPSKELLPPLVLKIREVGKMISTYYNHIIDNAVDVQTLPNGREVGVLHCRFNQSEAMTGRFSSSDPNLQKIPRILGPRECFIPRVSRRNWHFDYEQVEMKLFAHFAEDEDMAEAITGDIHLFVASQIYGIPPEQVTKEQRKRAKAINFGILYGAGPAKMAESLTERGLHTTTAEAAVLVQKYHQRFPSIRRLTNKYKVERARFGFVENPFERRYHIEEKYSYKLINYMCQGTSADIMKAAMVRVWKWLRRKGFKSRILLQVHDELAIEMPRNEESRVVPMVKLLMQDLESYFVPITVGVDVVTKRWSKKLDPVKDLALQFAA
jgi:DNA polymerase I-like protein with 3'-5' exonuclease and polymerase domains